MYYLEELCVVGVGSVGGRWIQDQTSFSDKGWLFLPLSETGKENEDLMCASVGPQYAMCVFSLL